MKTLSSKEKNIFSYLGGLAPISTIGTGSSKFSGPANGVDTIAKGIPVLFNISLLDGIAHIVTLINLGEQFPLSIDLKVEPESGGTFLPTPALVLKTISLWGRGGRGI